MRVVVGLLQEVGVVGRDDRQPEVRAQREDPLVELGLALAVVPLDLEVVPVLEDVRVPRRGLARGLPAIVHQVSRHLAREARARHDHPSLWAASSSRSMRGFT